METDVSKVLYMRDDPSSSPRIRVKIWVLWWALVIPALGTWRQENLRGSACIIKWARSRPVRDSVSINKVYRICRAIPEFGIWPPRACAHT